MRKSRILGCALTLAATLMVGGAMGQTEPGSILTDYVKIDNGAADANKSFVTAGKKVSFYVLPDLAFAPAYKGDDNSGINKGTTWTWTIPNTTDLTFVKDNTKSVLTSDAAAGTGTETANYVEITAGNAAKVIEVQVQENLNITGFSGCNADPKKFFIHIFPMPTVTLNGSGTTIMNCGEYTLDTKNAGTNDLKFSIDATDNVNLKWHKEIDELILDKTTGTLVQKNPKETAANVTELKYSGTATLTDGSLTWTLKNTKAFSEGDKTTPPSNGTFTLIASGKLSIVTGHKVGTMYRYYMSMDAKDGVNDFVSRKSDFLDFTADKTKYTADNCTRYSSLTAGAKVQEVKIYVMNKPTTGPVYHVANNKGTSI